MHRLQCGNSRTWVVVVAVALVLVGATIQLTFHFGSAARPVANQAPSGPNPLVCTPTICPPPPKTCTVTISGVTVTVSSTGTSATVTWSESPAGTDSFSYGIYPNHPNSATPSDHSVTLSSLTAGTVYAYEIEDSATCSNGAGGVGTYTGSFWTSSTGGGTCPKGTIAIGSPSAVQAGTQETVSWSTSPAQTTPLSMSQTFQWGTVTGSYTNSASVVSEGSGNWEATVTGLTPASTTTYYYEIIATATCYNSGTSTGSFTVSLYPVEIYSFESFYTVELSSPSTEPESYSNGSVAELYDGGTYSLSCEVSTPPSDYMATPFVFGSWFVQGSLSIGSTSACDTTVTVSGGSGSGVIALQLGESNSIAYAPQNPVTLGGYSSGGQDTYTLYEEPLGGYVYGSEYQASTYPEGTVYQASGTFTIPSYSYEEYSGSSGTYTGPEVAAMWVGIGGYNYWDNSQSEFNDGIVGSLWQAGVAIFYSSSSGAMLIPWVWDTGFPDPYCYVPDPATFGTSNALNCDPVTLASGTLSGMQSGDQIAVTVGVQPCTPGTTESAAYAIIQDVSRVTAALTVNYWDGTVQSIYGCAAGVGPVYYPDYHTAEWMVGVPTGGVPPSISGNIVFTSEEVSPTIPSSFTSFTDTPCPNNELNAGAGPLAWEITAATVSGVVTYSIKATALTPLGSFDVTLP